VSKKMGRPTDSPKTHQMKFRYSDEIKEMLEHCSKEKGVSKSEVIRLGIGEIYKKLTQKQKP